MEYHINYDYGDYESDIEEYRSCDLEEHYYLFDEIDLLKSLNDEVEIIEDKKIYRINRSDILDDKKYMLSNILYLSNKINQIIDVLNEENK